jgi:hypothetical protein
MIKKITGLSVLIAAILVSGCTTNNYTYSDEVVKIRLEKFSNTELSFMRLSLKESCLDLNVQFRDKGGITEYNCVQTPEKTILEEVERALVKYGIDKQVHYLHPMLRVY